MGLRVCNTCTQVTTTGTRFFIVQWKSPDANGGDEIDAYRVAWGVASSNLYNYTTLDANTTVLNITGLAMGSEFEIRVSARNSIVWSQNSTLQHATLPPGPGNVVFGQDSFEIVEADKVLTLSLSRRGGSDGVLVARVRTHQCSALPASQYTALDTDVIFLDYQVANTVEVQIFNDDHYMFPFGVLCVSVQSLGVEHGPWVNITLVDDGDAGFVNMTVGAVSVLQNAGFVNVSVSRHAVFNDVMLVAHWKTMDVTAHSPTHYGAVASGAAILGVGVWVTNVSVQIVQDTVYHPIDLNFTVTLTGVDGGAVVGNSSSTVVAILDDGVRNVPPPPPPPLLVNSTGGCITFDIVPPTHNGSRHLTPILSYVTEISMTSAGPYYASVVSAYLRVSIFDLMASPRVPLVANTGYFVRTAAVNSVGEGPFSLPAHVFTLATPTRASKVQRVRTVAATGGTLSVMFSPPVDLGGEVVDHYVACLRATSARPDVCHTVVPALGFSDSSTVFFGLLASRHYEIAIAAVGHSGGRGAYSGDYTATTGPVSTPIAPTNLQVVGTTGGAILISVSAPLDTGGVYISSLQFLAVVRQTPAAVVLRSALFGGPPSGISAMYDLSADNSSIVRGEIGGLEMSTSYSVSVTVVSGLSLQRLAGLVIILQSSIAAVTSVDLRSAVPVGSIVMAGGAYFSVDDLESAFTSTRMPFSRYYDGPNIINETIDLVTNESAAVGPIVASTSLPTVAQGALPPVISFVTGGAITVTIRRPSDNGGIPLSYVALYMAQTSATNASGRRLLSSAFDLIAKVVFHGLQGNFTQSKLSANTLYSFYTIPENVLSSCVGLAPNPSTVTTVATTAPTSPSAPLGLTRNTSCATCPGGLSGGSIAIFWSEPFDLGGVDTLVYFVQMSTTCGGPGSYLILGNTTLRHYQESGLQPNTEYCFRIQSSTAAGGIGQVSDVAEIRTPNATKPGAPAAPARAYATGGLLTVGLVPPDDDGGSPVLGYEVFIKPYGLSDSAYVRFNTSALRLDVGNLTAETDYGVKVSAVNVVGASVPSPVRVMSTTSTTAPSQPLMIQTTDVTGGSLTLAFDPPFDNGGSRIVEYKFFVNGMVRDVVPATGAPPHTVFGLDFQTTYAIAIQAVNAAHISGVASNTTSFVTSATPTAPTAVEDLAEVAVTGGAISFVWSAPRDSGGVPLQRYRIYEATAAAYGRDASALARVRDTLDSQLLLSGLPPNTSFVVCVTALNNPQLPFQPLEGPCSLLRLSTTGITFPSAPVSVAVTVLAVGSVLVSWASPIDVGGSDPRNVSYTVYFMDIGAAVTQNRSVAQNVFSCALSGLSGIAYDFSVAASSPAGGMGPVSVPVRVGFNLEVGAPTLFALLATSASWALISWQQPYAVPGVMYLDYTVSLTDFWHSPPLRYVAASALPLNTSLYNVTGLQTLHGYGVDVLVRNTTGGRIGSGPRTTISSFTTGSDNMVATYVVLDANIVSGMYRNGASQTWEIRPASNFSGVTITFTLFDIECDHDLLRVYYVRTSTNAEEDIWSGGCPRAVGSSFVVTSELQRDIAIQILSDSTVRFQGFVATFHAHDVLHPAVATPPGRAACPGSAINPCSGNSRGVCTDAGTCVCRPGYYGESCAGTVLCPGHHACSQLTNVIAVAPPPLGSDTEGLGAILNPAVGSVSPKPFASLGRAVLAATMGSIILILPGTYSGSSCGVTVTGATFNITTAGAGFATTIECSSSGNRALEAFDSKLTVDFMRFSGGSAAIGGILRSVRGFLLLRGVHIASGVAADGGCVALDSSTLVLDNVIIRSCVASRGGAVLADNSSIRLGDSLLSQNSAEFGGGIAFLGSGRLDAVGVSLLAANAATYGGNAATNGTVWVSTLLLVHGRARFGGSIYALGGSVTLSGVVARDSFADLGGIMFARDGALCTLVDTAFENGTAAFGGGGVFATGGARVIGQGMSTVRESSAPTGGCVEISGSGSLQSVVLDSCRASLGGGVFARDTMMVATDVQIRRCTANFGAGGAWIKSTATLYGTVVEANVARYLGGAVYLVNSTLVGSSVTGVMFANNSAAQGGGIGTDGESSFTNATVAGNRAIGGGGLFVRGLIFASSTTIESNSATDGGGVMVFNDSQVTMAACTVIRNAASLAGGSVFAGPRAVLIVDSATSFVSSTALRGGAVSCLNCALLRGLRILNSSAVYGGGIHVVGAPGDTTVLLDIDAMFAAASAGGGAWVSSVQLLMSSVTVSRCTATTGGGLYFDAVSIQEGSTAIVSQYNSASEAGGNVYSKGVCTVLSLTLLGGSAVLGAGAYCSGGSTTMENSAVVGNTAMDGGGLYAANCALQLSSVNLYRNHAMQGGGGLFLMNSVATNKNVSIAWNTAQEGAGIAAMTAGAPSGVGGPETLIVSNAGVTGGGTYFRCASPCLSTGRWFMTNVSIAQNSAKVGGGVYVDVSANLQVNNVSVSRNSARSNGGGLAVEEGGAVAATSLVFSGNDAAHGAGGAVYVLGIVTMAFALLENNTASTGAGIAVDGRSASFVLNSSSLVHNVASLNGGALSCTNGGTCIVESDSFSENVAGSRGGSLYMLDAENVFVHGSTLTGRTDDFDGETYSGISRPVPSDLDAVQGGGLYALSCKSVSIANSTMRFFVSTTGAAVYAESTGLVIRGAAVSACYGGAMAFSSSVVVISELILRTARALFDGGGLWFSQSRATIHKSSLYNNHAQQGGAVFLDLSSVLTMSFVRMHGNVADVNGGGLYVSRFSSLLVNSSESAYNMAPAGAALYTSDAFVSISRSNLVGNRARFGGGIGAFRNSSLQIESTWLLSNEALSGGAIYMTDTVSMGLFGSTLSNNSATEGGGLCAQGVESGGKASLVMVGCELAWNTAARVGGGISLSGVMQATIVLSTLDGNAAAFGGGLGHADSSCALVVARTMFAENAARQQEGGSLGGGLYSTNAAQLSLVNNSFVFNLADAGGGFWWRWLPRNPRWLSEPDVVPLACDGCVFLDNSRYDYATQALSAAYVSLVRDEIRSGVPSTGEYLAVRSIDYFGQIVNLDFTSTCTVTLDLSRLAGLAPIVLEGTQVARNGLLDMPLFTLRGPLGHYVMHTSCNVNDGIAPSRGAMHLNPFNVTIGVCLPGWALAPDGACALCKEGEYSPSGDACVSCPTGGLCSIPASASGNETNAPRQGVILPSTEAGYWLAPAAINLIQSSCHLWRQLTGPCVAGTFVQKDGSCRADDSKFRTAEVYACYQHFQFYECPVAISCVAGTTQGFYTTGNASGGVQCLKGYEGVLCATCIEGYSKSGSGLCSPCSDTGTIDSTTRANTIGVATIFVVLIVIALLIVSYGVEEFVVFVRAKRARWEKWRARGQGQSTASARAAEKEDDDRTLSLKKIRIFLNTAKQFGGEKTKMFISFAQIFSNFRTVLKVKYPPKTQTYMTSFDFINLDVVKVASLDCISRVDYYSSFTVLFFAPLLLGAILISFFAVVRYWKSRVLYTYATDYQCPKTAMFSKLRMTGVLLVLSEEGAGTTRSPWLTAVYRVLCFCFCCSRNRKRSHGVRVSEVFRVGSPSGLSDAAAASPLSLASPKVSPENLSAPSAPAPVQTVLSQTSLLSGNLEPSSGHREPKVRSIRRVSIDDSKNMHGHDRLTALALLASHGTRPMRIWYALNAVRDWHGNFGTSGGPCDCIPRDPCAKAPFAYQFCKKGGRQWYLMSFRARVTKLILSITMFAYAPLAAKILNMFNCVEIAGVRYLRADYSLSCDTSMWLYYALWAFSAGVLYIAGIPFVYYTSVSLTRKRFVAQYMGWLRPYVVALHRANAARERKQKQGSYQAMFSSVWAKTKGRPIVEFDITDVKLAETRAARLNHHDQTDAARELSRCVLTEFGVPLAFSTRDLMLEARQALVLSRYDAMHRLKKGESIFGAVKAVMRPADLRSTVEHFLYRSNLETMWASETYGFIYAAFTSRTWWFENVELFRKLVMNGIIMFFAQATVQLVTTILAAFAAVCVVLILQPYRQRSDNMSSAALMIEVFLTSFVSMVVLLQTNVTDRTEQINLDVFSYVIMATSAFVFAWVLWMFLVDVMVAIEDAREQIAQLDHVDDHIEGAPAGGNSNATGAANQVAAKQVAAVVRRRSARHSQLAIDALATDPFAGGPSAGAQARVRVHADEEAERAITPADTVSTAAEVARQGDPDATMAQLLAVARRHTVTSEDGRPESRVEVADGEEDAAMAMILARARRRESVNSEEDPYGAGATTMARLRADEEEFAAVSGPYNSASVRVMKEPKGLGTVKLPARRSATAAKGEGEDRPPSAPSKAADPWG